MKRALIILASLGVLGGAVSGYPEDVAKPAAKLGELRRSAEKDLESSVAELNKLRERIEKEKVPLAEQLTAAEEELAAMRRDYEKTARLVDAGNLELVTIKAETKARRDEADYVGNLLDEYAKTFESKAHVSELQYCGDALNAAKQATENTALTLPEKFEKQLNFVGVSVKRLFDASGGMRFPGVAVDAGGTVQTGQFCLVGPVALFRADNGEASGLALPQTGSPNPMVRPLDGALQTGLDALAKDGEGMVPLDPTRGGALRSVVQKTSVKEIFIKGGPIMWPLLLAAVLAVLTVMHRVLFLMLEWVRRSPRKLQAFLDAAAEGDTDGALAISRKSGYYVLRVLGYALENREKSLSSALLFATEREMKRFRRGIAVLDTVITLAPLLGLLGTVTGMMGSFSLIGGELSAPGAITGGIAEALIATAFGLGIAITALIPFNFLNNKIEEARIEIEKAASQLELAAGGGESLASRASNGSTAAAHT